MKTLKRAGVALASLLLFAAGVAAVRVYVERRQWAQVISIEQSPAYQSPELLEAAFALPVAAAYRQGGLAAQPNVSFCGPTTVVDVLRSLGKPADPSTVLAATGVSTWFGVVPGGLTLDELADVMRKKTGRKVTVHRDLDLPAFRLLLARANDPSVRVTANFHRGPLFGRGGGHHSPIGGYLAGEDLVLVLDVNPAYPPWLVRAERLYEAVDTVDASTGKTRGLLVVE